MVMSGHVRTSVVNWKIVVNEVDFLFGNNYDDFMMIIDKEINPSTILG